MIICFNCSTETKRALDSLLKSGQYRDYNEAISLAIKNLAVLQEEVLKRGGLVIGADTEANAHAFEGTTSHSTQGAMKPQEHNLTIEPLTVPAIFHLDGLADYPLPFVELPDDIWAIGQEIPLGRWIFGQYNRLLPAKASCRALARLLLSQPKGILLEEAAQRIAQEAAVLGDFLAYHDKQNDIARDDALSTAFPSTGENSDKSRLRYANQFVASVNKHGQVSGLLMDLKLINGKGRKTARLMLTEVGWQFAIMPNPILDDLQETPIQKFTKGERDFLLDHIARSVPVEDFAYRVILSTILKGKNTPDTVNTVLLEHVPQDTDRSLSKSFLSSQRSGAISRMTDLGLVERVRDGVRVSYVVTGIGEKYVQNAR
ncbi:MAG: hypothetical protein KAX24_01580 [Anaerolineae bacterium]|nr:hypothetical protein [Anaerolineae bacterium]